MNLLLNLIMPLVLLLVASMLKKHPCRDMDSGNGYNTPAARKSRARWEYAQSIAPEVYLSLGKTLLAVEVLLSAALLLLRVPEDTGLAAGITVGVVFMLGGFFLVDSRIEENFPEN